MPPRATVAGTLRQSCCGRHGRRFAAPYATAMTFDELRADWDAVADDAGTAETDVRFLIVTPAEGSNYGATYWRPGLWPIRADDAFAYSATDLSTLHALREEHVVVVAPIGSSAARMLLLRHEAEHVSQQLTNPAAMEVAERLAHALPLPVYYHSLPHERAADQAATRFARAHEIDAAAAGLDSSDRFLYAAPWHQEDPDGLPFRLVAFSLFYPDEFDAACRSSQNAPAVDPDTVLEQLVAGAAAARSELRQDYSDAMVQIADANNPTQDPAEWAALPLAERHSINDRIRAALAAVEAEIVVSLRGRL